MGNRRDSKSISDRSVCKTYGVMSNNESKNPRPIKGNSRRTLWAENVKRISDVISYYCVRYLLLATMHIKAQKATKAIINLFWYNFASQYFVNHKGSRFLGLKKLWCFERTFSRSNIQMHLVFLNEKKMRKRKKGPKPLHFSQNVWGTNLQCSTEDIKQICNSGGTGTHLDSFFICFFPFLTSILSKQDWKTSVLKPEDKTVMTENGCFCDFYDFYDFYEF